MRFTGTYKALALKKAKTFFSVPFMLVGIQKQCLKSRIQNMLVGKLLSVRQIKVYFSFRGNYRAIGNTS